MLAMIVPRISFQATGLLLILLWKKKYRDDQKEHERYTCKYGSLKQQQKNKLKNQKQTSAVK